MDLPIEFEDVDNEKTELQFNAYQSEDEMSDCLGDSDSSSCTGNE